VKSLGFTNFSDYYEAVIEDRTGRNLLGLVDRLSTNHSYFFREAEHFDLLTQSVLPQITGHLTDVGSRDLRIWCAGCAAGEEAYTLAMVLAEYFGSTLPEWDIGILGTDISMTALEQALEGVYGAHRVGGVPARYRKYLKQADTGTHRVVDSLKPMVVFKRLNLMRETYPFKGKFHLIFCRNVMIYFDQETKRSLAAKFQHYLQPNGYLFIGHSETLGREVGSFRYVQPTVYQKC
jgi:chemotaxis protein methyltransferase CheR